jgi:hypothetical protein
MTLDIQPDRPAAEVEIRICGYDATCRAKSCRAPAALIALYIDDGSYFVRQFDVSLTAYWI